MSTGIRCWDPSGNLVLDFTDRISKVISSGILYFSNYNETQYVYVSGFADDGNWYVVAENGVYVTYYSGYFSVRSSNTFAYGATPYTVLKT